MTFEAFVALCALSSLTTGCITYVITLFRQDDDTLAIVGSIGVAVITVAIFILCVHSPALYENSYRKMLDDRPECLNRAETVSTLECQAEYAGWILDSVEITNRYLSKKDQIEKRIERARSGYDKR